MRGLVGRSFTSWAALDGVGTRALRRKMNMDRVGGDSPITDPQAFVHDVWLKNGRVFTRIGPWIGHRRELVREIRRHVRESRDAPGRVSGA